MPSQQQFQNVPFQLVPGVLASAQNQAECDEVFVMNLRQWSGAISAQLAIHRSVAILTAAANNAPSLCTGSST
jgi:hypothetical protein